jgi:hypothetical protein
MHHQIPKLPRKRIPPSAVAGRVSSAEAGKAKTMLLSKAALNCSGTPDVSKRFLFSACFKTIKAPVLKARMDESIPPKNTEQKGEFSRKRPSGVVATSVTARCGDAPDVAPSDPAFLAKTGAILFLKQAPSQTQPTTTSTAASQSSA